MWVPSLLVLTVRRRRWSLSLCRCVVHSRCHHRCPLSVFHPQSTPRAVARGAGCGWCVVRSRSRHRWLAVVGVHVHEHFVRNCFVLPGFPGRHPPSRVSRYPSTITCAPSPSPVHSGGLTSRLHVEEGVWAFVDGHGLHSVSPHR